MAHLTLATYIKGIGDVEAGRYRILAGLQAAHADFSRNRLFPPLADLVSLYRQLEAFLSGTDLLRDPTSRVVGLDAASKTLLYGTGTMSSDELANLEELVRWSMPLIVERIEEGKTIHEFVEKHARLDEVGIVPAYVDEGYLLVPDLGQDAIHVMRYEMTIFSNAEERFRNLKTEHIRTIRFSAFDGDPWSIKQDLLRSFDDLPNPATFAMVTSMSFPYDETLLPIAKRALLQRISRRPN